MALWDALETPWGPLVPSMAIPWGLLEPFGATGRAFEGQMGSSWAKPGAKCDPNLSQNVTQNVTKSKAEILSNFGSDLGHILDKKHQFWGTCWAVGCRFCTQRGTLDFAYSCNVFEDFYGLEVPYMHPNSLDNLRFCKALILA